MKIEKINQGNFGIQSKQSSKNKQNQSGKNVDLVGGQKYACAFKGYWGFSENNDAPKTLEDFLNVYIGNDKKSAFKTSGDNLYKLSNTLDDLTRHKKFEQGHFTVGEFVDILKKALDTPKESDLPQNKAATIEFKRKYLSELVKTLETSDIDKNLEITEIDVREICYNLADKTYLDADKDFEEYNKKIEQTLEYGEGEPIVKLNPKEEFEKLSPETQDELASDTKGNIDEIVDKYIGERCFANMISKDNQKFETAALQTFPRYNSSEIEYKRNLELNFKYPPLYRMLKISDIDEFLKQFEIGGEYSYPVSQSCSKSKYGAEAVHYSASDDKFNVEFRIHPKSETSKAYDVASLDCNKATDYKLHDDFHPVYRTGEAIYPANAKFKVIGIYNHLESDVLESDSNNLIKSSMPKPDHHKIFIDLQEI